ncbi:fibronectin type III domain protein [Necator americanus]|uniref:Fibronectin type III domain protein n=1 Tax=Necator americanus TaxID=51031 RepID=W2TFB9_NECAM|nr:fibronectin type III domain protein [Necator americanus]ETN79876.1 fibronectin type III domain protein [Necator americanus]
MEMRCSCTAINGGKILRKVTQISLAKPGDVPTNITWSFDENDSLLIDWSRILYPNGNVTYILYLSNFVDRVSGPPGYTIYFKKSEESEEHAWQYVQVNANRTRFTIDESIGLEQDAHYKMKISATNERHEGPASEISWFDTYVDIGEDLPAPENVTAYLRNSSLVVHIPLKHAYQNFIIYVRPESSEQYWKYEAVNVTEAQETIIIRHFPLDKNDR